MAENRQHVVLSNDDFAKLISRMPISSQSFTEIRKNNLIYVDKTDYIYRLAQDRRPKFLSRPRRFGKSTIVSTLEELFLHGIEPYDGHDSYFKGLKIEKLWRDHPGYAVLRISLVNFVSAGPDIFETFVKKFSRALLAFARKIKLEVPSEWQDSPSSILEYILTEREEIVLLIDEYDSPIIAAEDGASRQAILSELRSIFAVIKERKDRLRFVFITGITRYKDAYLLTQGNNVADISQDPMYAGICGCSPEEILENFKPYLEYAIQKRSNLNKEEIKEEHYQNLLAELAEWYDGYTFDSACSRHVFSNWSLLLFFADSTATFKCFWYQSVGFSSLLRKAVRRADLEDLTANYENGNEILVSQDAFANPASLDDMDPSVLLFQTGYLTLAHPYNDYEQMQNRAPIALKAPNLELKTSWGFFMQGFIAGSRNDSSRIFQDSAINIADAIEARSCGLLLEELNLLFNAFDYEGEPIRGEASFTAFIEVFLLAMARFTEIIVNRHEAGGRPDITFKSASTKVVFENKFVNKKLHGTENKALEAALEQIRSHRCGQGPDGRPENLWRVALVYSGFERRIVLAADADAQA